MLNPWSKHATNPWGNKPLLQNLNRAYQKGFTVVTLIFNNKYLPSNQFVRQPS